MESLHVTENSLPTTQLLLRVEKAANATWWPVAFSASHQTATSAVTVSQAAFEG